MTETGILIGEEEARTKFIKARIELMRENPFFSYLSLYLRPEFTDTIVTAGVSQDGTIYINPKFINSLSAREIITVIAHEIMHLVTDSHARGKGKDALVWNMASDSVNNEVLENNGFMKINGWFLLNECRGWTAEEVYYYLIHNLKRIENMSSFDVLVYDERECESGIYDSGNAARELWKTRALEAQTYAKACGKDAWGTDRLIDDMWKPRWSPRALLERYINYDLSEENWQFADKKRSGEVIFPAEREESLVVGFTVDTSGSMSEKEVGICKGAIAHVLSICEDVKVEIVECDAYLQDHYTVTRNNMHQFMRKTSFKGGGGTDYRPVIEYFNTKSPKLLMYATDLCCDSFGEPPKYDVIWLKVGDYHSGIVPYGKVVKLNGG